MKKNVVNITVLLLTIVFSPALKADTTYTAAGNYNPLVPGYFADPTIQKFGDTYYLYATTDGIKLASGEPQVWISKDFVNWYNYEMDVPLPTGLTNCWAPDVVKGKDGKYY
jgi:xylan 1,4-beta-xylosidase